MAKHERVLLCIFGKTNSGKTYLLQKKILKHLQKPVFVIDPEKEYSNLQGELFVFSHVKQLQKRINKDGGLIRFVTYIFQPVTRKDNQTDLLFLFLSKLKIPLTLIIEEAGLYMDSYSINSNLQEMMFQGAHHGYNLVFVAQRPTQIHNDIFTQVTGVISFLQTGRGDINKLRDFDDAKAKEVPDLDPHQYEFVSLGFLPKKFGALKKILDL